MGTAERIARLGLGAGRVLVRLLPGRVRRAIDDRVFGVVFQVTRVTNDHYGWRPEPVSGRGAGGAGTAPAEEEAPAGPEGVG